MKWGRVEVRVIRFGEKHEERSGCGPGAGVGIGHVIRCGDGNEVRVKSQDEAGLWVWG